MDHITFVETDHEIIPSVIHSLSEIKEGHCQLLANKGAQSTD